jgi:DHA2 family multidrug resistance protein
MSFGQVAFWPLVIGVGVPMFFIPLNMVGLGSVDPEETASAAGLLNFLRTLSGAVATSLVNTIWDDKAARNQTELAGALHDPEGVMAAMQAAGMSHDQALASLTGQVQSQAVVMATNQLLTLCAIGFAIAAFTIWMAPRPRAGVDISAAH